MQLKCKNCKYWDELTSDSDAEEGVDEKEWRVGNCRRNAPVPRHFLQIIKDYPDEEGSAAYVIEWPFVKCNEWCGEFKNK